MTVHHASFSAESSGLAAMSRTGLADSDADVGASGSGLEPSGTKHVTPS